MRHQFASRGMPLAIEPKAFGMFFDPPPPPVTERREDVAIVSVRGPLEHHAGSGWCDSYDAIRARVAEALSDPPRAVVMAIDSPGGLVSGALDTADEIRALCDAARVPLYAFVDGQATSAAYALACVAERVVISTTGVVGSIGVIAELVDVTKLEAAMGIERRFIASGERKTDGNPRVPVTDAAVAATRSQVEQLAGQLFAHVARRRPIAVEGLAALEASLVLGANAVPTLADEVMGLDQMVAAIAAGTFNRPPENIMQPKKPATAAIAPTGPTASKAEDDQEYESAIAALRKRAAAGDERAKRMLQAELAEAPPADDDEEEDPAAAAAPAPSPAPADEDAKAIAARAEAKADKALARQDSTVAQAEATERATLIASRADLDEPTRELMQTLPLEQLRSYVTKAPRRALKPAATAIVSPTRASGQEDGPGGALPPDEGRALAERMGIVTPAARGPHMTSAGHQNLQVFPTMTRQERLAWGARREKELAAKAAG